MRPSSRTPAVPGRRGRPTAEQVVAIETAIVTAAWRLFLEEGYSATSMEAVASRARVSKGTLYARFATKEALFAGIVVSRVHAWSAKAARQDFRLGTGLHERLEHHAIQFLDRMCTPEIAGLSRLLLEESRRFPELGRIIQEKALGFAADLLFHEIEAAAEKDHMPVRNARAVAHALLECLYGWTNMQTALNVTPTAAARRRIAKHRVSLLMAGRTAW
jgi:AcrR family transcriptional regulator